MASIKGGKKYQQALANIARQLKKPGTLRVGFFSDATYPNGTKVATVAAIQNYGAPKVGIPPRPFFSNMVKDNSSGWPKIIRTQLKLNNYDAQKTLMVLGQVMHDQLQESIRDITAPPLSKVTLMLRKMKKKNPKLIVTRATVGEAARRVAAGESVTGVSTKPEIDTAVMLSSVDFEVSSS